MAENQTVTLSEGDIIEYIREDAGGLLPFEGGGGWHLVPNEEIVAGKDIPVSLCQRLIDTGRCSLVRAVNPAPVSTPSATDTKTAVSTPSTKPSPTISAAGPLSAPAAPAAPSSGSQTGAGADSTTNSSAAS